MTRAGSDDPVVVIGAGMGGLAAGIDLAAQGVHVTLFERAVQPGGKMRTLEAGGARIDAGPTVLTFKRGFEQLFADAGADLDSQVRLTPADRLARHAWSAQERFDLHADPNAARDAVGAFAGPEQARLFARFQRDGRRLYETLEPSFLMADRPSPPELVLRILAQNPAGLFAMRPFASLWRALGDYFPDTRLRQLFARYATYCGASPFQAPATLMMIAALEQQGVWFVEGGMVRLAEAMAGLAESLGATLRYNAPVAEILTEHGRACGVRLASGEIVKARAVLANADPDALRAGLLGEAGAGALAPPARPRSLSAVVWTGVGRASGFDLDRHTVVFSRDYRAEFDALFSRGALAADPTVYICAQDRGAGPAPAGEERFLILMNAPANGDVRDYPLEETDRWLAHISDRLKACGLDLALSDYQTTAPDGFVARFPGSAGALYGRALHGWRAAFQRPGARTRLPGLYLAGGAAHPGPGVPTSMLSGRIAARSILTDFASTPRFRPAGIAGSTPTRSTPTEGSASS